MRYLLLLLLALPASAAEWQFVGTNFSLATNVFVTRTGPTLSIMGQPVVASATIKSSTNHNNNTVKFYVRFTVDGTNWTRTNEVNTLVATTFDNQTGATIASNFAASGFTGVRLASVLASTVTNIVVSNFTLGTWHLQK